MHNQYRRDGRTDNTRGRYEERSVPEENVSFAKHINKKVNAFGLFLRMEGIPKFKHRTGLEKYVDTNPEHKQMMKQIHDNSERKQEYEAMAKRMNANRPLQTRNKHKKDKDRRDKMFEMGRDYAVLKKDHRQRVNETHVRNENAAIPLRDLPPIHYAESQKTYLETNKKTSVTALKSYLGCRRGNLGNPLISEFYTIQLVSVFPTIYAYRMAMDHMVCYPAEIGVTTFHLKTGVIKSESIFVMLDKAWFGDEEEEFEIKRQLTGLLGVDIDGPTADLNNLYTPNEAFHWLTERFQQNKAKRIVVDENQLNYVYHGVQTLACSTGAVAIRYFQEMIHPRIVSIQDYTRNLIDLAPSRLNPSMKWSNEKIVLQFLNHKLVPSRDHDHYCEGHDGMRAPHKYYCVKAHNARLLHNFFYILKQHNLEDISEHISDSVHCNCIEDLTDKLLPTTLKAATVPNKYAGNIGSANGNNVESEQRQTFDEDNHAFSFGYSHGDGSARSCFSNDDSRHQSFRSNGFSGESSQWNGDHRAGPSNTHGRFDERSYELNNFHTADPEIDEDSDSEDECGYLGVGRPAGSMIIRQPENRYTRTDSSGGLERREPVQQQHTPYQPESENWDQHTGSESPFLVFSGVRYVTDQPGTDAQDVREEVLVPQTVAPPASGEDSYAQDAAISGEYREFAIDLINDRESWSTPFVEYTYTFKEGEYFTSKHRYHWENPENQITYRRISLPCSE